MSTVGMTGLTRSFAERTEVRGMRNVSVPKAIVGLLAVGALTGCIAVSRETVPSRGGVPVSDRGHWDAEQVWQCRPAGEFSLAGERASFQSTVDGRLDDGWDLADFDVVSIPEASRDGEQVCLVATFRRWIPKAS
jgi:hypothetical protein